MVRGWWWPPVWVLTGALAVAAPLRPGDPARVDVGPGTRVHVRAGPGTGTAVVARLPHGTPVRVVEVVRRGPHDWARVTADDGRPLGWIRADLLVAPSVAEPAPAEERTAPAPPPPRQAPSWFGPLLRNLEAVDVCLAATTKRPAGVVDVSELPFEMVSVVVRDGSGRLWDCVVERGGGAPLRYDPLPPAEILFGREPDPVFYRGDGPSLGTCAVAEPARDPGDGRILGTLARRTDCE